MMQERKIKAGHHCDLEGKPKAFTLSEGADSVTLEPGKSWIKVDTFKWVTRGLIEPPQSFQVLTNGTVEINGEKITLEDREGLEKLEHEINKRHVEAAAPKKIVASGSPAATAGPKPTKVQFKVRLDHLGHLMVECLRGTETMTTGLRGLPGLIQNGLLLKPTQLHIDPLQRYLEVDHRRFECSEAGALELQGLLNAQYAPSLKSAGDTAIDIHENPASPTGFDIRFVTSCAGVREEVKGHLSQEKLDLLQDSQKCGLLQADIMLRISPPFLLIRRRRPDGGEEKVPEVADVQYRRTSVAQLQQLFDHPALRKAGKGSGAPMAAPPPAAEYVAMRLGRHPQNKLVLWLECLKAQGGEPEGKALTHHNVAELQQRGVFLPQLDVSLSLDNRTLSILHRQTHQEQTLTVDLQSSDADIARAGQMLTEALRPPAPKPAEPPKPISPTPAPAREEAAPNPPPAPPAPVEAIELAPPPAIEVPPIPNPPKVVPASPPPPPPATRAAPPKVAPLEPTGPRTTASTPAPPPKSPALEAAPPLVVDPTTLALFQETDPLRINQEVFRCLTAGCGVPVQDLLLSLPHVFENRRFLILSFSHPAVESVLDLRTEQFNGFYLSHINERKVLFVYACRGRHLEWGPGKCVLQASPAAEPSEYRDNALRGLALHPHGHFVFVVEPKFKEWVKAQEKPYEEAFAHFLTVRDLARQLDQNELIWPERPGVPPPRDLGRVFA